MVGVSGVGGGWVEGLLLDLEGADEGGVGGRRAGVVGCRE
jgi:hypothetical protein